MQLKETDLFGQLQYFWEWVAGIKHWNTFEGWTARIVVWFVSVYVLLLIMKHVLELFAKICESWKSLGFRVRISAEERARLRRRQQFCKVLTSDLGTLAKAENWNDQFFTDLEAEVEATGQYYASPLDRLRGRKSRGLRRVPSLIQAIESSTEQCLLLTGDPGSGKSVALRHLANQMAEKGSKSKRSNEKIPLYLNLKELPSAPVDGPTADFIKEFVFENIRRGDADTAAYVRENWSSYRETGTWFFLFDSFDEIPDVLHAPTGSPLISQYADAIRQFLEGMSECRGVLASREFKGPDALAWERLRILPLRSVRQEELVENSFLMPHQRSLVLQHVASNCSGILTNPLFLTLLCRYVKDEKKLPTNDNELLLRHIHRLANREPEYIRRRYNLTPEQLIRGSIGLAVLFAQQPSLSLAPTQDDISRLWSEEEIPGGDLEILLAALIDVKIGRCDVKEAKAGDRRFTFSHRRYQETLFVEFLARDPSYLAPASLLTDTRWREYVVTLLQTSQMQVIAPLMAEAERLLEAYGCSYRQSEVIPQYGTGLRYFEWDGPATDLLRTLQEGLCRRLDAVPDTLRKQVERYLDIPWKQGDAYDRVMVLSLGGLLPEKTLRERIEWAVENGTPHHWTAAFTNAFFLKKIPEDLGGWFRQQLAARLLSARERAEVLRLEAIAARSPANTGAGWVVDRTRRIRSLTPRIISPLASGRPAVLDVFGGVRIRISYDLIMFMFVEVLVAAGVIAVRLVTEAPVICICVFIVNLWMLGRVVICLFLYAFRGTGGPVDAKLFVRRIRSRVRSRQVQYVLMTLSIPPLVGVVLGLLLHAIAFALGCSWSIEASLMCGCLCAMGSISGWQLRSRFRQYLQQRAMARQHRWKLLECSPGTPLALYAESWQELYVWMRDDIAKIVPTASEGRSLLTVLRAIAQEPPILPILAAYSRLGHLTHTQYWRLSSVLLDRLLELGQADAIQEMKPEAESLPAQVG